jgi:hypothetical protein
MRGSGPEKTKRFFSRPILSSRGLAPISTGSRLPEATAPIPNLRRPPSPPPHTIPNLPHRDPVPLPLPTLIPTLSHLDPVPISPIPSLLTSPLLSPPQSAWARGNGVVGGRRFTARCGFGGHGSTGQKGYTQAEGGGTGRRITTGKWRKARWM